jgi:hypothetical protein
MIDLLMIIPGFYYFKTRITSIKAVIFHSLMEWLPAMLIAYLATNSLQSTLAWSVGFIAFFAIYELGYFVNDLYSVRFESNPRLRYASPPKGMIVLWVISRIVFVIWFVNSTFCANLFLTLSIYLSTLVVFAIHNFTKEKYFKMGTFLHLAILRFYGPLLSVIPAAMLVESIYPVIMNYGIVRLLIYQSSKNLGDSNDNTKNRLRLYLGWFNGLVGLVLFPIALTNLHILNVYFLVAMSALFIGSKINENKTTSKTI